MVEHFIEGEVYLALYWWHISSSKSSNRNIFLVWSDWVGLPILYLMYFIPDDQNYNCIAFRRACTHIFRQVHHSVAIRVKTPELKKEYLNCI